MGGETAPGPIWNRIGSTWPRPIWTANTRISADGSELNREKAWSRLHLVPAMLAEQDRDVYRRTLASNAREEAIMKDVPGWEGRTSNTGKRAVLMIARTERVPHQAVHPAIYRGFVEGEYVSTMAWQVGEYQAYLMKLIWLMLHRSIADKSTDVVSQASSLSFTPTKSPSSTRGPCLVMTDLYQTNSLVDS